MAENAVARGERQGGPAAGDLLGDDASAAGGRALAPAAGGSDYFVEKDGLRFAGAHLFLDMWGARNLDDRESIEAALRGAARDAGATVLHAHFHRFQAGGGVSGVVVLAESHISIHTWPERAFAAIDIFMCGNCDPYKAVPALRDAFAPQTMRLAEQRRGLDP